LVKGPRKRTDAVVGHETKRCGEGVIYRGGSYKIGRRDEGGREAMMEEMRKQRKEGKRRQREERKELTSSKGRRMRCNEEMT
jgi:hypothetical protein